MTRVSGSGLLGAGVLTAGITAAMFAGAGAANATPDEGSDPGAGGVSNADNSVSTPATSPDDQRGPRIAKHGVKAAGQSREARRADRTKRTSAQRTSGDDRQTAKAETDAAGRADGPVVEKKSPSPDVLKTALQNLQSRVKDVDVESAAESAIRRPLASIQRELTRNLGFPGRDRAPDSQVQTKVAAAPELTGLTARAPEDRLTPTEAIPIVGDVLGPFQPDYPPLVRAVGSAVFNLIGAVVQTVDGPPTVPPDLRDSVQVSSSTLEIAPGNEVPADWYYPTSGAKPQRLIYLQHGILASGPMYSYTAAYLAERTNSVVVVTTVTSNPFADDGMWLGGDNMHKAAAQLFLDDERSALNTSFADAAGTQSFDVPKEFVLVGHSLGGGFAPGVAGYYAEGLVARRADGTDQLDEENHLAGVVLLDAVPFSPILPNAMDRLKTLENSGDPNDYIPVYEIGAPLNYLNSLSSVNGELTDARPGKFNGVVISGGVHMDGMLGGNPLIQNAAYLVAGFPQPQNPPAVQLLMAGWINDMFEGNIDPATGACVDSASTVCHGEYGTPGDTIPLDGGASAVVIDENSVSPIEWLLNVFRPREATSLVPTNDSRTMIPLTIAS